MTDQTDYQEYMEDEANSHKKLHAETQRRKTWYTSRFLQFELVKQLNHREMAFLKSKVDRETELNTHSGERGFKAFAIEYLEKHFAAYKFHKKNWDLYYSVASFSYIPTFSYYPAQRKEQRKEFFGSTFEEYWTGYDFVIDVDAENLTKAHKAATKIKKIYDEFDLPYSLRFSGTQGFHFVIEYEDIFPKILKLPKCVERARVMANNIKEIENIKDIDVKIYQKERLLKLPYSICGGNVALPLTDQQFERFTPEIVKIENVLKTCQIKNRGTLIRQPIDLNIKEFIKIYGEDYHGFARG